MKFQTPQEPALWCWSCPSLWHLTPLDIEAAAVLGLKRHLGAAFVKVVGLMLAVQGRVVVMGMGKSGHIGRKIVATLASTGTAAMFVHPAEASHGDLGMIKPMDVVLAISNSGESDELTAIPADDQTPGCPPGGYDRQPGIDPGTVCRCFSSQWCWKRSLST